MPMAHIPLESHSQGHKNISAGLFLFFENVLPSGEIRSELEKKSFSHKSGAVVTLWQMKTHMVGM